MATSTNINTVQNLDQPYLEDANRRLLASVQGGEGIQGLIDTPYENYNELAAAGATTPRLAPFSQDQMQAFDLARQGVGAYQPYIDQASQTALSGYDAAAAGYGDAQAGFNLAQQGYGDAQSGYDFAKQGYGDAQAGFDLARAGYGDAQSGYNLAQQGYGDAGAGYTQANQLLNQSAQYGDLSRYQNPYQQQVIDTTMSEMRRQQELQQDKLDAQAAQAQAYGGSRHGVAEAEMERGHDQNRANTLAQLNQQGYLAAQAAQEQHRQRQGQAGIGIGNASANLGRVGVSSGQVGLGAGNVGLGAGNVGINTGQVAQGIGGVGVNTGQVGLGAGNVGLGTGNVGINYGNVGLDTSRIQSGLGKLQQDSNLTDVSALGLTGGAQQQQLQGQYDINYNQWLDEYQDPFRRASFTSDIIKGIPSSQSSMTAGTVPQKSNLAQGIGALGQFATMGNQFGWWGNQNE
jgi:hypothetical protein